MSETSPSATRAIAVILADGSTTWVRDFDEAKRAVDSFKAANAGLENLYPAGSFFGGFVAVDLTSLAYQRLFREARTDAGQLAQ